MLVINEWLAHITVIYYGVAGNLLSYALVASRCFSEKFHFGLRFSSKASNNWAERQNADQFCRKVKNSLVTHSFVL